MKKLLAAVLLLAWSWPVAQAQSPSREEADYNAAAALCEQSARDHPVPVRDKILLGRTDQKTAALLEDASLPTPQEAGALADWQAAVRPCTRAMQDWLTKYSPAVARMRADLTARNEKIVAGLAARRISYGEANRQFVAAQHDFDLLYAAFLQARRRQVLEQQALPLLAAPPAVPSDGNATQNAQDNATVERLLDEALKARRDAVRPGLCPSNPAGLPGPPPDPVSEPFC